MTLAKLRHLRLGKTKHHLDAVASGSLAALQHWPRRPPDPAGLPSRCLCVAWLDDYDRGVVLTRHSVEVASRRAPRVERIDELLAALAYQERRFDPEDGVLGVDPRDRPDDVGEAYQTLECMLDCLVRTGDPDVDFSSDADPESVEEDADA